MTTIKIKIFFSLCTNYIALVRHLILSLRDIERDPGKAHGGSKETSRIAIEPVGDKVRSMEPIEEASCGFRFRSAFGQVPLKNWWVILIHVSRPAKLAARIFLSLLQLLSDIREARHSLREHFPGGLGLFLQSVLFQGPPHIVDLKLSFSFSSVFCRTTRRLWAYKQPTRL
jgi:hypothetical protein